jgi:hypothetical protein
MLRRVIAHRFDAPEKDDSYDSDERAGGIATLNPVLGQGPCCTERRTFRTADDQPDRKLRRGEDS